jgi:DNA-binding MarR family transcriptional regulator
MSWREYGYVIASKYRVKVVFSLYQHPKTPSQIAGETGLGRSHVSRTLKELLEMGITLCLTPNARKGKVYQLTKKGKVIAELIIGNQKPKSSI